MIKFQAESAGFLRYSLEVQGAISDQTNFMELRFRADTDEEVYGLGLQSDWNHKGKSIKLLPTREQSAVGLSYITNKGRGFTSK